MTRSRITQLALTLVLGLTALSGCGGSSEGDDGGDQASTETPPPAATTPATTPAAATTDAAASTSDGLTPAGSTLKIGEAATIAYDDSSKHLKSDIAVTPEKIEKGTIADFKNITLDADQKTATPFYAHVSVKNVGTGNLTGTDPASYIDAVDDRGQRQSEIIFLGDFDRCDGSDPKSLKPGESYDTCLSYLIPKGGSVVGMRWVFYDQKTMKSDINWK